MVLGSSVFGKWITQDVSTLVRHSLGGGGDKGFRASGQTVFEAQNTPGYHFRLLWTQKPYIEPEPDQKAEPEAQGYMSLRQLSTRIY